jgi:nucleotide-binding universal stress UspA family protein
MTTSTSEGTAITRPSSTPRGTGSRVLVATDLGPTAESTLRIAHARASASGGRIAVVHVSPSDDDDGSDRDTADQLRALVRDVVGSEADAVDIRILHGDPAAEIAAVATTWAASLLVIGRAEPSRGVVARMFAPGVVVRLIRNAPCDVLVSGRAPATGRVVVGSDLEDPALPILRAAAAEQARRAVTVYAVHCIDTPELAPVAGADGTYRRLAAAAAEVGLAAVPQVVSEVTAEGLVAVARELAADLIIVGSHGEAGRARLLMGSVAQDVVEDAPCPVLVVRLPDAPH